MPRDRNRTGIHWSVTNKELQSYNCDAGQRGRTERARPCSPVFLRELEGEVLENVALNLLIARYLQRDFRILSPL